MAQGIGYKDTDGSYGFRLTEDGKVILGNSSDDVIQVTGTLSVSGTFYAGTETPEQYHQVIGRFLVDAAGTNNSELIIDGPNPNFIMLQRAGTLTGKMATDGYRFTMYGGSNMVSQAYTDSGVGKIDFCNSNTQVTSGTKHKVNITASSDALRIDTDSGTNVFRVSGDTLYTTNLSLGGTTITATGTELNYVDGVTSAIQTQLDAKAPSTGIAASALASDCIVATKIDTSVAGDGLSGGGGSALSVNVDDSTIDISSDSIRVKPTGVLSVGGLTVDTDSLHVDTSNNRVGIGTTTPAANLSIEGDADGGTVSLRLGADNSSASNFSGRLEFAEDTNGSQVMTYGAFLDYDGDASSDDGNGQLNIGMRDNSTSDTNVLRIDRDSAANSLHIKDSSVAVGTQLHVTKNATVGDIGSLTLANAGVKITDSSTNMHIDGNSINTDGNTYLNVSANYDLYFGTNNTERMRIKNDGKVGINDTTPSYTLDVNGDIRCTDDLFVDDFARIDALRVGTTSTDPGDGNLYIEGDITLAGGDIKDSGGHNRISFGNTTDLIIKDYSGNTEMTISTSGVDIEGDLLGKSHGRIAGEFSVGTRVIVGDSLANISDSQGLIQIKQESDDEDGGGLTIEQSATSDEWTIWHSTAENLNFSFNGSSKGYLNDSTNVSNITFTGQHRCSPSDSSSFTELSSSVGKIVVSDGTYSNLQQPGVSINESIPKVTLSTSRNQKSVFGVVSDAEDENSDTREYSNGTFVTVAEKSDSSDNRLYINSLGEGGIWITNINGNIENGDYITTCEIPGYGMKQDDDLLHNYTVAKITQDCLFDLNSTTYECEEIQHNGQTYRVAFVGCTYHCG